MSKTSSIVATSILILGSSVGFCQTVIPDDTLEKLQSTVEKIRACKEEDITPIDPTAKDRVPFTLFQGPPLNVIWDIKKSDSIIKPYYGVIEFVTYSRMWAPDALKQKNKRLSDLVAQSNLKPDSLKHRYVFEPVHGDLVLTTMTEIGSDSKEVPEPRTFRCWQLAAGIKKDN
jgi:hypothetical protein